MSTDHFTSFPGAQRVCWKCFSDEDLVEYIKQEGGPPGCDFCGRKDAATADFPALGEFVLGRFEQFYGSANELPYESAEGGYQGTTYSSWDLISKNLDLLRDAGDKLFNELVGMLGDELWADYDWLSLDEDVLYGFNWKKFCDTIKHERRFFFQQHNHDEDDRESISPIDLLALLVKWVGDLGLIVDLPVGTTVYRARKAKLSAPLRTPGALGPPPRELALQANRMNPAGIPMMYCADKRKTAIAETPGAVLSTGRFSSIKPLSIVDLSLLPAVPGFFSDSSRQERLILKFLHRFRDDIELPVARTDGAHIDYLPSQVVTEYLRSPIDGQIVHGVRYRSVKLRGETNVVFFAEQENIKDAVSSKSWLSPDIWLEMTFQRTMKRPKGI